MVKRRLGRLSQGSVSGTPEYLTKHYRWQFLRRNKMYQSTYQNITYLLAKEPKPLSDVVRKEVNDAAAEFGINKFYDPKRKKAPKDLRIEGPRDFVVRKGSLERLFKDHPGLSSHVVNDAYCANPVMAYWGEPSPKVKKLLGKPALPQFIQVVINCDSTIPEIQGEICRIMKESRLEVVPGKRSAVKDKQYDIDLKIYDLKKQHPEYGRKKIAVALEKIIKENKLSADSRDTESQVKDALKRMRNLIDERGYKTFRYS